MRPVQLFGRPDPGAPIQTQMAWVMDALQRIADSSQQESLAISDTFTVSNLATPKHTHDVTGATLLDVSKVVGTLLADMKKRGVNSGNG